MLQDDGLSHPREPVDAIWVNGGVTHPSARWLEGLRPGGRLALALTSIRPRHRIRRVVRDHFGRILHVRRRPGGYAARFTEACGIQALLGGRDPALQRELRRAFEAGDFESVRSLRTDAHAAEDACWMHSDGYCLSKRTVGDSS